MAIREKWSFYSQADRNGVGWGEVGGASLPIVPPACGHHIREDLDSGSWKLTSLTNYHFDVREHFLLMKKHS